MQKKLWIGLEGMEFYAYHGVYETEKQKGTNYLVDVFVFTEAKEAQLKDDLTGTVNYELIYDVVAKNMQEPVNLIEHLAHKIIIDLRLLLAATDSIKLKIKKLHPPLSGQVYASVVEVED